MKSNTKIQGFSVAALITALIISTTMSVLQIQMTEAQQMSEDKSGDLTAPSDGKPFGGEKIGTFTIKSSDDNKIEITAKVDTQPSDGKVLEGWLVDTKTEYKLSLGQVEANGELSFSQRMVNPSTYNVLVITEEDADDPDPNAAMPVGGSELESPFGL